MDNLPPLYTREEVAEHLRLTERQLRRLIAATYPGRRMIKFTAPEIELLRETDQQPTPKPPRLRKPSKKLSREGKIAARAQAAGISVSEALIVEAAVPWKDFGSGIYFLIRNRRVVYVGRALNVLTRVNVHRTTRRFDSWHWIPCPENKLDIVERAYINALLPVWNRDHITLRARKLRLPAARELAEAGE